MLRFFLSLNIVWAISCVIMYWMVGLDPSKFWLFSIVSLFIPVVFIVNLLLIVFWLIFDWKKTWIPVLTILLGWNPLLLMFSFGEEVKSKKCSRDAFSIMSYNVYGLKQLKDTSEHRMQMKKTKFTSFIRQYEPDILCVQEDNFFADGVINNTGLYPYFHYIINHGAAIYSKYPILDKGMIDFGTKTNSCLWVELLIKGKVVKVYSLHLQSNQVTKDVAYITDEKKQDDENMKDVVRSMFRKYRNSAIKRSKQAEMVVEDVAASGKICLIAGDFNDAPFSHSYKTLVKNRSDSFLECGYGIGSTYNGALPGLRIDFILADLPEINFCSHKILPTRFSDHNAIMATCIIKS